MKIHIVGDSHSAYSYENLASSEIYWLGPVTMHRCARDGFEFLDDILRDASKGDYLITVFGEIDIRCHIARAALKQNRSIEDVVLELATLYVDRLAGYAHPRGINVIVSEPLFPANRRPNPELPFVGTIEERVYIHGIMGRNLSDQCKKRGLQFLPMPQKYRSPEGLLRRKYSDDGVHIVPCEAIYIIRSLRKYVKGDLIFNYQYGTFIKRRWNYFWGGPLRRKGLPLTKPVPLSHFFIDKGSK